MAGGKKLNEPVIPGLEAAGVVDQVGEGVTGVAVGDAVFGLGRATYAEYAVLRAWAPKPESHSFAEAAGLGVAGETALGVLDLLGLKPGQVLLVHGAAGGVALSEDVAGIVDAAGTQMAELLAIAGAPDHIVTIANYAARDAGVRFSGGGLDPMGALAHVA